MLARWSSSICRNSKASRSNTLWPESTSRSAQSDVLEVTIAGGTWKRCDVAAGILSERSHLIRDRPRQLEVLIRVIRSVDRPPARILHFGAGDGVLLECLLEVLPEASGVAVDFSPVMVKKARERLSNFGPRATVAVADLDSPHGLEAVESPFDAVVRGLAIHHLEKPTARKTVLSPAWSTPNP